MSMPRLDWRDPRHFSPTMTPCRWCEQPTHSRDDIGRPACKPCAEDELPPISVHRDLGTLGPNPELSRIIIELGGYCPTCQRFICNCIARREAQR